jgi:integrase
MPRWTPLHTVAVKAIADLRREPVIDAKLFRVKGSRNPGSYVSHAFEGLCLKVGLTRQVKRGGEMVTKHRWTLHDLRRKSNTDLRNGGASAKERAALLGHRTTAVNASHYEARLPGRERALIDALPAFGVAG